MPLVQLHCEEEAKTPSGIEYTHFNTLGEVLRKKYTPGRPFFLGESKLYIFTLEDIPYQLYPHPMRLMTYQKNFKDCFWRLDPSASEKQAPPKTGEIEDAMSSHRSGKGPRFSKKAEDYQVRIAGPGVSPPPERIGLSRFSPKYEQTGDMKSMKSAEKSLSSEFMTNRETFADQSTSVKSMALGSSRKFQQPTLQMLNPELF